MYSATRPRTRRNDGAARQLPVRRGTIAGPLMRSSHCHCRQCQKAPFRTRARVAAADFRFLAGEELVSFYELTPGTHRGLV